MYVSQCYIIVYFASSAAIASTHTRPFNGPLSGTIRVSRYRKGKTNLDFTEARDSEWQWAICKSALRSRTRTHSSYTNLCT